MHPERLTGGFWLGKQELIRHVTNDAVYDRFHETGRIRAFACGYPDTDEIRPHYYWDSDVAKWIEGSAYLLAEKPDAELERKVESIIDDIEKNQQEDGYYNIYFQTVEKGNRFTRRDYHELYCAGHLMEAACAYFEATGKDRFLKIMCKYADLIYRVFVEEKSAAFRTPGHEEIELAAFRLYKTTGEKKYLELARYFVLARGTDPVDRSEIYFKSDTCQDNVPCRRRKKADGHAVRMLYLACGMADIAEEDGDAELKEACKAIFEDILDGKYNIIGGFAAAHWQKSTVAEAFPLIPYYLPNETSYNETCAAISFVMFASRMLRWWPDGRVADLAERAMFNNALSGMSVAGNSFFYTNPTEVHKSIHALANQSDDMPITERVKVFSCSCCPPNLTRFYSRLAPYAWYEDENRLFIHQYMALDGEKFAMETEYPLDGTVHIVNKTDKELVLRVPGFVSKMETRTSYELKDGYAYFGKLRELTVKFVYAPQFIACDERVSWNNGKAALQWGPLVYCAEGQDNGNDLWTLCVDTDTAAKKQEQTMDGLPLFTAKAYRRKKLGALYAPVNNEWEETEIHYIPYYCFANRGEDDMAVWITRK